MSRRPPRTTLVPHPTLFRPPVLPPRPPFRDDAVEAADGRDGRLVGQPASVGRARGRARVVAMSALLPARSEEHTSELQSRQYLVCRLLLEKKKLPYKSRSLS